MKKRTLALFITLSQTVSFRITKTHKEVAPHLEINPKGLFIVL
jgi:hypothetical protein